MKANRKVYAAAAGWMAALMTVATGSAQTHLVVAYSGSAGPVSGVSVANLKPNWVATGVVDLSGTLELIVWESTGTSLKRMGSAFGPVVPFPELATVAVNPNLVITVERSAGSFMQLTSWSVSSNGTVTLGSTTPLVPTVWASEVALARLDASHIVAAFRGELDLFSVGSNGSITQEDAALYPSPSLSQLTPSVAAVGSSEVVTAVVSASSVSPSSLEIDTWSVNGNTITHQMSVNPSSEQLYGSPQPHGMGPRWARGGGVCNLVQRFRGGRLLLESRHWRASARGFVLHGCRLSLHRGIRSQCRMPDWQQLVHSRATCQ
jgi:hypothetical protein